jgi:hypothetical protein
VDADKVNEFLERLGMGDKADQSGTVWDNVILLESSFLIMGDKRTGKSALAYWLLERYSHKYDLLPAVVGLPREKQYLLPKNFVIKDHPDECATLENAIIFIDEAGLQLPIEDTKAREYVVNFLSLPGHRNQILLLAFHFPKLVLSRYLPFFDGFLVKRPPYLLEFAGKRQNDVFTQMMIKAEERFEEIPRCGKCRYCAEGASCEQVRMRTYVVAPRIRWQGMLENPLSSFWQDELSKVWAGTEIDKPTGQVEMFSTAHGMTKGWLADDPEKRTTYPVTPEMERRAIEVEQHQYQNSCYVTMEDPITRIRWIKQVY